MMEAFLYVPCAQCGEMLEEEKGQIALTIGSLHYCADCGEPIKTQHALEIADAYEDVEL